MGKHIVVLNSLKAAVEMLDKKSSKYSDRPTFTMCGELIGVKHNLAFLPYGSAFRACRAQLHRCIGTHAAIKVYHDIQELEIHRFLKRVYDRPDQLPVHTRR